MNLGGQVAVVAEFHDDVKAEFGAVDIALIVAYDIVVWLQVLQDVAVFV